jgi:MOSC domain-containing protein YiiM
VSINCSRGGVPKQPVEETGVSVEGLEGDRQRDRRFHGGPARAVTLYCLERIEALQQEGHPIAVGSTGENLTVSGLSWETLAPGTRLRVGAVRLEVTSYAAPCSKIAGSFLEGRIERISQKHHPGWSRLCARVIEGGRLRVGDPVAIE